MKLDSLLLWFYLSTYVKTKKTKNKKHTQQQQQQLAVLSYCSLFIFLQKGHVSTRYFMFHKSFLQENHSSKLPHLTSGSSTHPSLPWINFQAHEITIEHSTLYFKFDFILILIITYTDCYTHTVFDVCGYFSSHVLFHISSRMWLFRTSSTTRPFLLVHLHPRN